MSPLCSVSLCWVLLCWMSSYWVWLHLWENWRNDTQHNNTQHYDNQYSDAQHNGLNCHTQHKLLSCWMLHFYCYAECLGASLLATNVAKCCKITRPRRIITYVKTFVELDPEPQELFWRKKKFWNWVLKQWPT